MLPRGVVMDLYARAGMQDNHKPNRRKHRRK